MKLNIVKKLTKLNFTDKDDESRVKYIVIHYFGSLGTAEAVANYFQSKYRGASAHYSLDESSNVYQSVEVGDIAWHCGAKSYKHPSCRNSNSIGIEVRPHKLSTKTMNASDKDWYFKDEVIDNLVEFTQYLMDKYNVPVENVIRHYDVTGKLCPRPMVGDDINEYHKKSGNQMWSEFKSRLVSRKENNNIVDTSEKNNSTFKSGDKVKLKSGAKQYNGNNIRSDFMNKEYVIKEIKNDRVVLTINNVVVYAVNVKDIESIEKVIISVTSEKNEVAEYIWDRLSNEFVNPYGVAGLMGNLQAESGLRSNNLQNTYERKFDMTDNEYTDAVNKNLVDFVNDKAGYGLAQWTYYSRKQSLLNYARDKGVSIDNLDMQIDFLIKELKGYKTVYKVLCTAKSVKEASDIVLTQFERPADQSDKVKDKRESYGLDFYNKYKNRKPAKIETPTFESYKVKITADVLNYRKGPGTSYQVNGQIRDKGIYTIVGEVSGWGKLKSGAGWICLQYTKRV